jgi:hypothetical protein
MAEDRSTYGDEIDLLDLLEILWDGKWLISSLVVLATLIGFGYTFSTPPKYKVTSSYSINNILCKNDCKELALISLINNGWASGKKGSLLSQSTTTPLDVTEYEAQLERINEVITNKIYTDAKNEDALIESVLPEYLFNSETALKYTLNSKRVIRTIDSGQSALTFNAVSVSKTSSKLFIMLFISAVFGGTIGVLSVLFRNALHNRKKKLTKA